MKYRSDKWLQTVLVYVLISAINGEAGIRLLMNLSKKRIQQQGFKKDIKETTVRKTLSQLKKSGLVKNIRRGFWAATGLGKKFLSDVERFRVYEKFAKEHKGGRDTIIIFDVPEVQFRKRNLLRLELVALGFEQLQKSVWIGGGPLPDIFIDFLKEKDIFGYVHMFTIKNEGTIAVD